MKVLWCKFFFSMICQDTSVKYFQLIIFALKATYTPALSGSHLGKLLYKYTHKSYKSTCMHIHIIHYNITVTEEQNYCSYSVVQYFAVSHQRLPMRQWSNNCASLCWARGNQGEIYEHNNESYARFNYNDPGLFEVCCCSWKPFALCLSPLHWTDKHGSSTKFAC